MSEASPLEPAPVSPQSEVLPSAFARAVGWATLRAMRWPGRKWAGSKARKRSRLRGGRRFKVVGEGGVSLDVWYSPGNPDVEPRIPIVFCHGWLEFKEIHMPFADRLNQRGHDVLLYDHRGHGHSTGCATSFGSMERLDLSHVLDAAKLQGARTDRVATIGFSLGAATVLQHAPTDPRIAGVIALAPFVNLRAAINSIRHMLTPWVRQAWLMGGLEHATQKAGYKIDEVCTLEAISRIHVPVMIVEGGRDRTLPPADHIRPLEDAKTTGTFKLFKVDRAGHGSLLHKQWPGLNEAMYEFLDSLEAQPTETRGIDCDSRVSSS